VWAELFPQGHTFELTRIFRQAEEPLVALLNDVRKGQLSQPSLQLLHRLARPLAMPAGIEPTLLFATNDRVDALNAQRLAQLPGPERVYAAEDAGQEPHLSQMRKNCLAEARLRLKEGAQVMLIKNLNVGTGLCNGAKGRVVRFTPPDEESGNCGAGQQGWPIVQFANGVEQVRRATRRRPSTVALHGIAWHPSIDPPATVFLIDPFIHSFTLDTTIHPGGHVGGVVHRDDGEEGHRQEGLPPPSAPQARVSA